MAEMTIRLRCDPTTGKKDIIISLRSDEDALPHEHEEQHGHNGGARDNGREGRSEHDVDRHE